MYRWENSTSKGVRRDLGNGFTVTEMTLEFKTVLFLGIRGERDVLKGTERLLQMSLGVQGIVYTVQKEFALLL